MQGQNGPAIQLQTPCSRSSRNRGMSLEIELLSTGVLGLGYGGHAQSSNNSLS